MLQHPFIQDYDDRKPLLGLYREVTAEVVTTVEDLPDDNDSVLDSTSAMQTPIPMTPSASTSTSTFPEASVTSLEFVESSGVTQSYLAHMDGAPLPNGNSASHPENAFHDNEHVESRRRTGSEDSGQTSADCHVEAQPVSEAAKKRKKKISTSGVLSAANAVPLVTTGSRKVILFH